MNEREFFYSLGREIYRLDAIYAELAKNRKVTPTLLWVLYALNDGKKHTQIEISQTWDLPKSTVNTLITYLKNQGYVDLKARPKTKREMEIVLTTSGQQYAQEVLKDIYELEKKVFDNLNAEDKKVIQSLNKLSSLFK